MIGPTYINLTGRVGGARSLGLEKKSHHQNLHRLFEQISGNPESTHTSGSCSRRLMTHSHIKKKQPFVVCIRQQTGGKKLESVLQRVPSKCVCVRARVCNLCVCVCVCVNKFIHISSLSLSVSLPPPLPLPHKQPP